MALLREGASVGAGAVGIRVSSLTHSVCSSMETAQNEGLGWGMGGRSLPLPWRGDLRRGMMQGLHKGFLVWGEAARRAFASHLSRGQPLTLR